jgi:hypothetical protein
METLAPASASNAEDTNGHASFPPLAVVKEPHPVLPLLRLFGHQRQLRFRPRGCTDLGPEQLEKV